MELEEKIYARLETMTDNVYALKAPEDYGLPATVYNVLTDVPVRDQDEDAHTASFATVQVDVYETDFLAGLRLARAIRRDWLKWEANGVEVLTCSNLQKSIDDTTDTDLYRVMMFYTLFVREDADEDGE
jgi:hypothetical protein